MVEVRGAASGGPWGPWATLGLGLVTVAGFVIAQGATLALGYDLAIAVLASSALGAIAVLVVVAARRGIRVRDYLALYALPPRGLAFWLGTVVLFALLWDALAILLGREVVPEFVLELYRTSGSLPLLLLAIVVAAPAFEELFFRGFLFEGVARTRLGPAGAATLTAALWAAIHTQYGLYEVASIFLVGLLLAMARIRTGSLLAPIAMHALINGWAAAEAAVVLARTG